MKLLKVLALCAALAPITQVHAELAENFRVLMVTQKYPPMVISKKQGHFARNTDLKGISVDLVREMFKRAGIGYDITMRYPLSHLYSMVLSSPDAAYFPMEYTNSRKSQFQWVGPLGQANQLLVGKNNKSYSVETATDISIYHVGAYSKSGAAEYLSQQGIPFVKRAGPEKVLDDLMAGDLDLWAVSEPEYQALIHQRGITNLRVIKVLQNQSYYLALNRNIPADAVRRLQHALDFMRQDGTLTRIAEAYTHQDKLVSLAN